MGDKPISSRLGMGARVGVGAQSVPLGIGGLGDGVVLTPQMSLCMLLPLLGVTCLCFIGCKEHSRLFPGICTHLLNTVKTLLWILKFEKVQI